MIYAATSGYRPHPMVLEAVVNKPTFDQTIHHDGIEIYSAAPAFVISAGGIRTKASGALELPYGVVIQPELSRCTDRGAAYPTVLMPAGGKHRTELSDFLRITGPYYTYMRDGVLDLVCLGGAFAVTPPTIDLGKGSSDRGFTWSNDFNTCVWNGFACGTNIIVPADMEWDGVSSDCLHPVSSLPPTWMFLDSSTCPAYKDAVSKKFYLVVYREPCPSTSESCVFNWGFFHAVSNPTIDFATFVYRISSTNAINLPAFNSLNQTGLYANGTQLIAFDASAMRKNASAWGITSVNSVPTALIDQWPLAIGGLIDSRGDGLIVFKSTSGDGKMLELDLRKGYPPRYEEK